MEIREIGVLGAGAMGSGIAHVFAQHGFNVQLYDVNNYSIEKAINSISSNIDRQIKKDIIKKDDKDLILNRIKIISELNNINYSTNLIIEAINEDIASKKKLFNELDQIVNPGCVLSSNTSSISITELASVLSEPRKKCFIGMHFMNPVPVMKLVEIINGYSTSNQTTELIKRVVIKIEKLPIIVKDYPGFVSNRILMPMINEAIFALYEGVADAESIDMIMKLGMNHPMGPLALADYIGLDICLNIMDVLYKGFKDSKYRACPLLKQMVTAGILGIKSGKGFYEYKNSA